MLKSFKNKAAFSLVELSIVLVIIGLLVGGTLAGTTLLKSAEVKVSLSEVQKLKGSLTQFQSLYEALPGDMAKATSYWSATTNGNGNGLVDAETSYEPFAALQQLNLSGLLEGSYAGFTGVWGSGFTLAAASSTGNLMATKGREPGALYVKCCSYTDYTRTLSFNNHISLFAIHSTMTKRAGILTPIEAYSIDVKTDDGVPDTGFIGASAGWNGSAYTSAGCYSGVGVSSKYDTAVAANKDTTNCQMQFAYDWN
jgi:prepilin-type N-terminal cleavage/methylation domain-containing protein